MSEKNESSSKSGGKVVAKFMVDAALISRFHIAEKFMKEYHSQKSDSLKLPEKSNEVIVKSVDQPGTSQSEQSSDEQFGGGAGQTLVEQLVQKQFEKFFGQFPWLKVDQDTKEVSPKQVEVEQTGGGVGTDLAPEPSIDVPLEISPGLPANPEEQKSVPRSEFDDESLLKTVPTRFYHKAQQLLTKLKENPNEVTWNATGALYIDGINVPNSDMKLIFRDLFKFPKKDPVPGYIELGYKIINLGLGHFIIAAKGIKRKSPFESSHESIHKVKSTDRWWFVGT